MCIRPRETFLRRVGRYRYRGLRKQRRPSAAAAVSSVYYYAYAQDRPYALVKGPPPRPVENYIPKSSFKKLTPDLAQPALCITHVIIIAVIVYFNY